MLYPLLRALPSFSLIIYRFPHNISLIFLMGNTTSRSNIEYLKSVGAPPMLPVKRSKQSEYLPANSSTKSVYSMQTQAPYKPPFNGLWSLTIPNCRAPVARAGQCHVYDPAKNRLIIAYGATSSGKYLGDMWELDLTTYAWGKLLDSVAPPRANCSSVLWDREMFIFGGTDGKKYFSDLHSVNIDTGKITFYDSSMIRPREKAVLFVSNASLFVWSGYNGVIINDMYEFSIANQQWVAIEDLEISGRRAAAFISSYGERYHYIFGSTRGHPLARFDTQTRIFEVMRCGGTSPPPELTDAMCCYALGYIFVFGGQMDSDYTYLYAINLDNQQWFAFYVLPDNDTTSIADGTVTKTGLFKLPRQHSGALTFSYSRRTLVCTMGSLFLEPPPISLISVGNALSYLHLRDDVLAMLSL